MKIKAEMWLPKLLIKFFYFFIMGLIFSGPFSFGQTTEGNSQVVTKEADSAGEIQEEHDTKSLDKVLKNYNKDQKKVHQDVETIHEMEVSNETGEKIEDKIEAELESFPTKEVIGENKPHSKKIDLGDPKKIKYSQAIKIALEPLQKMNEEELKNLLIENTKGQASEAYIKRFPKIVIFAVRLIKDKEALPMLVKIADDSDKLIGFLGIMLSTVLVGFFLKRLMKKEGRDVLSALFFWFIRFSIMTSLRFGILYYFYAQEISPTLSIAYKSFF